MLKLKKKKMTHIVISIALLVALIITAAFVYIEKNNDGYRTITVIETEGTVVVVKDGIEYQAYSGMMLQEGYEIITSSNSFVRMVLDGDKYIKVESGSKMVFETLGLLGSGKTKLVLERGSMTNELVSPLKEDEEYVVNTPNAVLAVRGTFFRVDLKPTKEGELVADVVTYGGAVATKKIEPDGKVAEKEVIVDAGRKVCINMDTAKTVYVVEGVKVEYEEETEDVIITEPINVEDIPDEDMVDIYYSVQNGHELFVTESEVEECIKDRDIKIEEYVSVYTKSEEVKKKQEGKIVEKEAYADDSKSIAMAPEQGEQGENSKNNQSNGGIAPIDGNGTHNHTYIESITKESTCTSEGEKTFTCTCGEYYTEKVPLTGHIKIADGSVECHSKCSVCDAVIEDGTMHEYTDSITTEATCANVGIKTYTCGCGHTYTEEIPMLDHTKIMGGEENCHSKCSECETILEDGAIHSFTEEIIREATYEEDGERRFVCVCGYNYSEAIPALKHTKVAGGEADCHSKCSECGAVLEDGSHHEYAETVMIEATCEEAGSKIIKCDCGYMQTVFIDALGHDYSDEYTVDKEASCTELGSKSRHCSRCESVSGETQIPMTEHTKVAGQTADCHGKCSVCGSVVEDGTMHKYTSSVQKEATCTDPGSKIYTCECGYTYTEEIGSLGHNYSSEYTIDVEPTCTQVGSKSRHCSRCQSVSGKTEVPLIAHTKMAGGTVDCHSKCSVCGAVVEDGTIHKYTGRITTVATCTGVGIKTFTCECGHSYTEEVPMSDHTKVMGGKEKYHSKCSECGITLEDGTAHNYTEEIIKEASHKEDGERRYVCKCGYSYSEAIPSLEHTKVAGGEEDCHSKCEGCGAVLEDGSHHEYTETVMIEPTCEETGSKIKKCDCGYMQTVLIDALGHDYSDEYTVDKEASCTETGSKSRHCSRCESVSGETQIPMIAHTEIVGGTVDCHSKCSVCGNVVEDGTMHEYTSTVEEEATCTDTGSKRQTCECGYTYNEEIQSLGHNYASEFTVDVEPTCTEAGSKSKHCSRCTSTSEVTDVPMLGHDYQAKTDAPTDTGDGRDYEECTNCGDEINEVTIIGINAVNFPDEALRTYVLDNFDIDGDTGLRESEANAVSGINIGEGKTVTNLKGIEHFTALETLTVADASGVADGDIDLTENTALITLSIPNACITELDVSKNTALQTLKLTNTDITSLDTSALLELTELHCENVDITTLDLSENKELTILVAQGSGLTSLDVTECTDIQEVNVDGCTSLTEINVSGCAALTSLDTRNCTNLEVLNANNAVNLSKFCDGINTWNFAYNTNLKEIQLNNNTKFTAIDLSQNTELEKLVYNGMPMTSLDLSSCGSLQNLQISDSSVTDLNISGTMLTSLDTSALTELVNLNMIECKSLGNIDLSNCAELESLIMSGASISGINVAGIESLSELYMDNCEGITALDISGCSGLTSLDITNCSDMTSFNASGCTTLTGVAFTGCSGLKTVNVSNTAVTTINVSQLTALESVSMENCTSLKNFTASGNESLDSIDISNCSEIKYLTIEDCTAITKMDVSGLSKLEELIANGSSNLTTLSGTSGALDFSNNPSLKKLELDGLSEFTTINLSGNDMLQTFSYDGIAVSELDVSANSLLKTFSISNAANLTQLDLSGHTSLTDFAATNCSGLTTLNLNGCSSMTSYNFAGCVNIENLNLGSCSFSNLDMSEFTDLENLTTLDVSGNGRLTHLDISTLTALNSISVANSGNMTYIDVSNTKLTGIDTSGMYNIETFICRNATLLNDFTMVNSRNSLKTLDMAGAAQLKSTKNINDFTNLESLDISGWDINSLDLISSLKGTLKTLKVNNTQLTGFNPAEYTSLKTLECKNIQMTTFSANNSTLEYLDISDNALLTQVNAEQTTALKTLIVNDCSSLTSVYMWGNALLENVSLKNNQVMGHVQPQTNPYLTVLDFTGAVAMISTNTMSLEGSGTSSGSLTIIVTDSPITRSNFTAGWDDSYMTIVSE